VKTVDLSNTGLLSNHDRDRLAAKGIRSVQQLYALLNSPGVQTHVQQMLGFTDREMAALQEDIERLLPKDELRRLSEYRDPSDRLGVLLPEDGPKPNTELPDGEGEDN